MAGTTEPAPTQAGNCPFSFHLLSNFKKVIYPG
jgi:hypothetical protein